MPLARGDDTYQRADARVAAVALLALVAAIVRGWSGLVPVGVALVGGAYAVELVADDAPLDLAAPAVAVGVLLAAELAYWSLDERARAAGEAGQDLRRAALVALEGLAAFVVASVLLALADAMRTRGLALDLAGAVATVGVLVMVLLTARGQPSRGS